MPTESITLQVDEREYEKLKEYLSEFGDPDVLLEIAIKSYIRHLNRAMPFAHEFNYNLRTYFHLLSAWLKQFDTMVDLDMFQKTMASPRYLWQWMNAPLYIDPSQTNSCTKKPDSPSNHQLH